MLDKARSQSKHMDESNAAASLLSMETTANNHHYLHNKTSRATLMNSSQDGKKHAEDEVSDGANSRHPTFPVLASNLSRQPTMKTLCFLL